MITPAEYLELISIASANVAQHASVAMAVLFAYIVVAYFVGNKLSRFQAIAITVLYTSYFALPVVAVGSEQTRISQLETQFQENFPDVYVHYFEAPSQIELYILVNFAISFLAWLLSIYFMYDNRKRLTKKDV